MSQELLQPIDKRLANGYLFGFGNPLLDQLVEVDQSFLASYGLEKDGMVLADEIKHANLFDTIKSRDDVKYVAGGATLNTLKMIQWLLRTPHVCTFAGKIENDAAGLLVRAECDKLKLGTRFQVTDGEGPTGQCAVLLYKKYRSMVTDLGVSRDYSYQSLRSVDTWPSVERAKIYYFAGFAVTACYEGLLDIAKHASEHDKLFTFNLSAVFMQHVFKDRFDVILPYVDILFGNEDEALAYGRAHELVGDCDQSLQALIDVGKHLSALPRPDLGKLPDRLVVITRAHHPTLVFQTNHRHCLEFKVAKIKLDDIVDTNGAGDAFVAGFLANYIVSRSVDSAIHEGMRSARYIIQRSGFSLGPRQAYDQLVPQS